MKSLREVDVSKINGVKFTCLPSCGKCCFFQLPMLTSSDINRIHNYLNTLKKREYENFLFNWLSSQGQLLDTTDEDMVSLREGLNAFWWPVHFQETENAVIVRNYSMFMMQSSGRCRMLDPLEYTCFIHDVKPLTCKLYPFTSDALNLDQCEIKADYDSCPGLGNGEEVNTDSLINLHQEYNEALLKDIKITINYLLERDIVKQKKPEEIVVPSQDEIEKINIEMVKSYYSREKNKQPPKKRIIEPLVEADLMPKHPLLKLWNKQFE